MIGWHFFREGSSKLQDSSFSSSGFLGSSKGPFAWYFQSFLKDPDGRERLNYNPHATGWNQIETQRTIGVWEVQRDQVAGYYQFDENQRRNADRVFRQYSQQLKNFFADNFEDINEYFRGLERMEKNAVDPARREVPLLIDQSSEVAGDYRSKRGPWLGALDAMWNDYNTALNRLATDEQRKRRPEPLELKLPGSVGSYYALVMEKPDERGNIAVTDRFKILDVDFVDWFIPRLDLTIGILLLLGLFTRVTASIAALFLFTIVLTQWPWATGAAPTYYQGVEMIALIVLAVTGAGSFAGLDFFIKNWRRTYREINNLPEPQQTTSRSVKSNAHDKAESNSDAAESDNNKPESESEESESETVSATTQDKNDESDS